MYKLSRVCSKLKQVQIMQAKSKADAKNTNPIKRRKLLKPHGNLRVILDAHEENSTRCPFLVMKKIAVQGLLHWTSEDTESA